MANLCRQCKSKTPIGARLCAKCGSYQDWRGHIGVSNSVLALLTALISVSALAFPAIWKIVHQPRSEAYLTLPALDGTTFRVVAINQGDAPAVIADAMIESDLLAPATRVRLRKDDAAFIPVGTHQITYDIVPLLDEDHSYQQSLEMMLLMVQKKPAPKTSLLILIAQSDGKVSKYRFPFDSFDLFALLRANADRCSAVKEPSFDNGCIGSGAPPGERPRFQ